MGKHFECSCPLAVSLREIPFCLSISPWLTDCWADARLKTPSEELGKWWVDSGDIVDFSWLCNIIEMENCFQVDFWKEQVDGMLFILMNFRGLPSNFIYWKNFTWSCLMISYAWFAAWNIIYCEIHLEAAQALLCINVLQCTVLHPFLWPREFSSLFFH